MTNQEILAKVAAGSMTVEEASIAMAKNAPKAGSATLHCKVSEKGALSVYGLQRMPVTLYLSQWERLLDFADSIRKFIQEHRKEFATKD